ncbi:MAG TPA: hypothetical protein VF438_02360 [Candidatus Paceibacterota bacterium]
MTVHSSSRHFHHRETVILRHIAPGLVGASHTILVVERGVPHLVSCAADALDIDSDLLIPDDRKISGLDRHFAIILPMYIGEEGFTVLAHCIRELRAAGVVTEPIRWCCREGFIKDFDRLSGHSELPGSAFVSASIADLSRELKSRIIDFTRAVSKAVVVACKVSRRPIVAFRLKQLRLRAAR